MGARRIYRAVTPYPHQAVMGIDLAQMVDVVFTSHWDYPVHKVVRFDHTDWRWSAITFGPVIDPPAGVAAVASEPNTTDKHDVVYEYVATVLRKSAPVQESRASNVAECTNDLTLAGNYNTINLPALPAEGDYYIIYRKYGGSFGYIGFTQETVFRDGPPPILPVLSDSPPQGDNPFAAAGDYPHRLGLHQQRLFLGKTKNVSNGIWFTRTADYENMDKARPVVRADDAGAFALVSSQVNDVKHLTSMDDLIVGTTDNMFAVTGSGDSNVITPGSINPKRQGNRGSSELKPLAIDNVLFYEPTQGSEIRSFGYTFEIEGYKSDDISLFSSHFFDGHGIKSWAYMKTPFSAIFAVRDDGVGLCFTWQIEQEVWGWTMLETDGEFEQFCVIPEDGYYRLYALITRTINGVERRFFELMALPHRDDIATACHLDCAVTEVFETAQGYVENLWHLEGETVSIVFDGNVSHGHVVTDGRVDLPNDLTANIISVGLRFYGEIWTLPAALMTQRGSVQTNRQQIDEVAVRTIDTIGIEIGQAGTDLEPIEPDPGDDLNYMYGEGVRDYKVNPEGHWQDTSYVVIQQNQPLPAHIIAVMASMKVSPK